MQLPLKTKRIVSVLTILCTQLFAQAYAAEDYQAPRNEFGQPDLGGTWVYASLTLLERPDGFESLTVNDEQAQSFVRGFLFLQPG